MQLGTRLLFVSAIGLGATQCTEKSQVRLDTAEDQLGVLRFALTTLATDDLDVDRVRFVVKTETSSVVGTTEIPLEEEGFPTSDDPELAELAGRRFADAFFVLPPGRYLVEATPLNSTGAPSERCAPASREAVVIASATTEIVLRSTCEGAPTGALDAILVLNGPPTIDDLVLTPSKFLCRGQAVDLLATASDPDDDPLTFEWSIVSEPGEGGGRGIRFDSRANRATFSATTEGLYRLEVQASDDGSATALRFPIHVSDCGRPNVAPVIIEQQPLSTLEETPLALKLEDLVVLDPDSFFPDDFTLIVEPGSNYSVDGTTITPNAEFGGTLTVPIQVRDLLDESDVFNLSVEVIPVNDIPEIVDQVPLSILEDQALTVTILDFVVIDPDNLFPDQFSFHLKPGDNYTLDSTGEQVIPQENFNGELIVPATVNDGTSDSASFSLLITVTPVNDPPLAELDNYDTVGNTELVVNVADGVLVNDSDVDATSLAISGFDSTSANGGTVALAADGGFRFLPAAGFSGLDTFTYNLDDGDGGTATGTVRINVGRVVWYVDNTASAPGDGRSTSPFAALKSAEAASGPGDVIFVFEGSGSSGLDEGVVLKDDQALIGHGVGLVLAPNVNIGASSPPTLTNTSAAVVTLASENLVGGLNIGPPAGTGIQGTNITDVTLDSISIENTDSRGIDLTNVAGTISLNEVNLMGSRGDGLVVRNPGNGGALRVERSSVNTANGRGIVLLRLSTADFVDSGIIIDANGGAALDFESIGALTASVEDLVSSNSSSQGIRLNSIGGTLTVNNTTTVQNASSDGIFVRGCGGAGLHFANTTVSGTAGGDAYSFTQNPGATIELNMLVDPQTVGGRGLFVQNSGLIVISTPGDANFSATGGAAIDLTSTSGNVNGTGAWTFANLSSSNSPTHGVRFEAMTSALTVAGTTLVDGPSSEGVRIANVNGSISFGDVTVNNRNATGVLVDDANTTSVSFGPVNLSGGNTTGMVVQNSATAMRVSRLDVDSGDFGLSLDDNIGSFTLASAGTAEGNGGTIQNMSENGALLQDVTNVALNGLVILNTGAHGIEGSLVDGFTFRSGRIENAGDALGEHAMAFNQSSSGTEANLIGTALIRDSTLTRMATHGLAIQNFQGTLNLTVDNVTFSNSDAHNFCGALPGCEGSGIRVRADAAVPGAPPNIDISVQDSTFTALDGEGIDAATENLFEPNLNVSVLDSFFENSPNGNSAVRLNADDGTLRFLIAGNQMSDWGGTVIALDIGGDGVEMRGTIGGTAAEDGNTIIANNQFLSRGISLRADADLPVDEHTAVIAILNNDISNTDGEGIRVENRDSTSTNAEVDVTIANNTVGAPVFPGVDGILVQSRDFTKMCAHLEGNSVADLTTGANAYHFRERDSSTFELEDTMATNIGTPVLVEAGVTLVAAGTCATP